MSISQGFQQQRGPVYIQSDKSTYQKRKEDADKFKIVRATKHHAHSMGQGKKRKHMMHKEAQSDEINGKKKVEKYDLESEPDESKWLTRCI
jgi:hypothetical protein